MLSNIPLRKSQHIVTIAALLLRNKLHCTFQPIKNTTRNTTPRYILIDISLLLYLMSMGASPSIEYALESIRLFEQSIEMAQSV